MKTNLDIDNVKELSATIMQIYTVFKKVNVNNKREFSYIVIALQLTLNNS